MTKSKKISILTPSIRKAGLKIVQKALNRQTFKDFEWLIGSSFDPQIKTAKWIKDDFSGGVWTLNRIYNKLIKNAKSDLLISWQDYTFSDPNALEKFYYHFKNEPRTLVSGVGNKYKQVYPTPIGQTWQDPREHQNSNDCYSVNFNDIEFNFCSIPMVAFKAIGGFDEQMDYLGYGMDGYNVVHRLHDLGSFDFKIDQSLKSYSLDHDRVAQWDENNMLGDKYKAHVKNRQTQRLWPKLRYID
jgi:hypothetical protein